MSSIFALMWFQFTLALSAISSWRLASSTNVHQVSLHSRVFDRSTLTPAMQVRASCDLLNGLVMWPSNFDSWCTPSLVSQFEILFPSLQRKVFQYGGNKQIYCCNYNHCNSLCWCVTGQTLWFPTSFVVQFWADSSAMPGTVRGGSTLYYSGHEHLS